MATVTQNELTVLQAIAQNEYNSANYAVPVNEHETTTFMWSLADGIYRLQPGMKMPKGKALSGTLSSLHEKGLVESYTEGPKDEHTIWLTKEGFELWKNLAQPKDYYE
jgi:hypothetical protein